MSFQVPGKRVALFTVIEELATGDELSEKKSHLCFIHTVCEVLVYHPKGNGDTIFIKKENYTLETMQMENFMNSKLLNLLFH